MKKILALALATVSLLSFTACGSTESTQTNSENPFEGTHFKVGCSIAWVPYENASSDGGYEGMNIELTETIIEKLGGTVEFEGLKFASLIGSVQSGHIDFTLGGMTPNPERLEVLDFSVGYFYPKNAIIFDSSLNITSLEDLSGHTIATSMGTSYQGIADSVVGATSNGVTNTQTAVQEILAGRTDACILDGASAVEYVKANPGKLTYVLLESNPDDYFSIGFPKESPYYEGFNEALKEMMENGELDAIVAKYLAEDFID